MNTTAEDTGPLGSPRGIAFGMLLFVVTLGFYGWYWAFKTHEEMKRHTGEGLGGVIGLVVWILLPVVSAFQIPAEIGKMHAKDGREPSVTGWTGLWLVPGVIVLIPAVVWFVKVQRSLNRYWTARSTAAREVPESERGAGAERVPAGLSGRRSTARGARTPVPDPPGAERRLAGAPPISDERGTIGFPWSLVRRLRVVNDPVDVDGYHRELVARLRSIVGRALLGVYAGGSYALGDFAPARSDVDVVAVRRGHASREEKLGVVAELRHEAVPCPARGLEFVLYSHEAARAPSIDADLSST